MPSANRSPNAGEGQQFILWMFCCVVTRALPASISLGVTYAFLKLSRQLLLILLFVSIVFRFGQWWRSFVNFTLRNGVNRTFPVSEGTFGPNGLVYWMVFLIVK